ncbi:hypothetical protein GQ44DRAFT_732669 [Phaeosphaeriaceae sp. PMI808]|nr:hypothetical protein GQ44DRAFT_732669 [Phaeosphaeriaceae sp. PMI808]
MPHQAFSPTAVFEVLQPSGVCKTFTTALLLLVALWVPTMVCSLTLGSSGVRRKLGLFSEYRGYKFSIERLAISILGSFLLQAVVWNVSAAALLHRNNQCDLSRAYCDSLYLNSFTNMYWIISIRPLAATIVSLLTIINPALFLENALEMQIVEGALGMFTIGIYDGIRKSIPKHFSWDRSLDEYNLAQAKIGLRRITDGSKLGVGMWVLSLLVLLCCLIKRSARAWTCWSIFFNFARMAASLAIWAGVPLLEPGTFCPSITTTGGMAVILTAVTITDHIWRALFCVGRVDWVFLGNYRELLAGRDEPSWPMDVTYFAEEEKENQPGPIGRALQRLSIPRAAPPAVTPGQAQPG